MLRYRQGNFNFLSDFLRKKKTQKKMCRKGPVLRYRQADSLNKQFMTMRAHILYFKTWMRVVGSMAEEIEKSSSGLSVIFWVFLVFWTTLRKCCLISLLSVLDHDSKHLSYYRSILTNLIAQQNMSDCPWWLYIILLIYYFAVISSQ